MLEPTIDYHAARRLHESGDARPVSQIMDESAAQAAAPQFLPKASRQLEESQREIERLQAVAVGERHRLNRLAATWDCMLTDLERLQARRDQAEAQAAGFEAATETFRTALNDSIGLDDHASRWTMYLRLLSDNLIHTPLMRAAANKLPGLVADKVAEIRAWGLLNGVDKALWPKGDK